MKHATIRFIAIIAWWASCLGVFWIASYFVKSEPDFTGMMAILTSIFYSAASLFYTIMVTE